MVDALMFLHLDSKERNKMLSRQNLKKRLFHSIVLLMRMNSLQSLMHGNQEFVEMFSNIKEKMEVKPILPTV
jgi:hypothetical protein